MALKLCLLFIGFFCFIGALSLIGENDIEDTFKFVLAGIGVLGIILGFCIRPTAKIDGLSVKEVKVIVSRSSGKTKEKTYYLLNGRGTRRDCPVKNYDVVKTYTEEVTNPDGTFETRTISRIKYRAK